MGLSRIEHEEDRVFRLLVEARESPRVEASTVLMNLQQKVGDIPVPVGHPFAQTRAAKVDEGHFTEKIYRDDKEISGCKIWYGGERAALLIKTRYSDFGGSGGTNVSVLTL